MNTKKQRRLSNANRPLPGALLGFARSTLTELGTHLSAQMASLLEQGRYGSVVTTDPVRPSDYSDLSLYKRDYLACELLSKFPIDIGIDREKVAIEAFLSAEDTCKSTNARFSTQGVRNWTFWERSVMETARLKIGKVLGPFDWNEASSYFDFGPGATTSLSRRKASTENKLHFGIDVTPGALHLAEAVWSFNRGWKSALSENHAVYPRVVRGSRIVTVPKNAKTDRVIAIEPDMNMFVQKGVGRMIRNRLRRAGLDLNRCWLDNHELAREGSLSGSYATIDLKSASDSISKKLVEWLLPPDWYEALSLCRSSQAVLPSGEWATLQKFSSMGNGYTFELESLIFWGLVQAVMACSKVHPTHMLEKGRISVFGDDIIVPVCWYDEVTSILQHAGFTVNVKKTFKDGPFRESCGKHYFRGCDVTPFYLREEASTCLTLIHALNKAREWSIHPVWGLEGLGHTYEAWRSKLPVPLRRPLIPYGYGDGALWGDFDEVTPQRYRPGDGLEGWVCHSLLPVNLEKGKHTRFSVLAAVRSRETVQKTPILTDRVLNAHLSGQFKGRLTTAQAESLKCVDTRPASTFSGRYRLGRLIVTRWPSFGPWLS